jgi:hypothetical protein
MATYHFDQLHVALVLKDTGHWFKLSKFVLGLGELELTQTQVLFLLLPVISPFL